VTIPPTLNSRRNLVIVRAGNKSLHPDWLRGPEARNWDFVISYFGDDPDIYRRDDVVRIDSKGPKWPPLKALLAEHPEYTQDYDYIWLPDDDLEMTTRDMNRFFDICREHDLELAQPSLTPNSPVTHPLVINNTLSRIRFTNFVEVMAPCFSAACLRRALPTFDGTQSGWGIDWLWPRIVAKPDTAIAIVDDVVIRHTRPLGGPNYDAMRAQGLSPTKEWETFRKDQGIEKNRIEIHRVLWRSGRVEDVRGRSLSFATKFGLGYLHALIGSPTRWQLLRTAGGLINRPYKTPVASKGATL